jgi:hypothetical protein
LRVESSLTVVASEDKVIDGLKAEKREEVPGQTGDPSHVKVAGSHAGLEHGLELRGEREREFH